MTILVTGCAGFIGMHLCLQLLKRGDQVVGIDNLNDYYSVRLKEDRLNELRPHANFRFSKIDITDLAALNSLFETERPRCVVNLAAQAGVRYSLTNPHAYLQSNIIGFGNILECCRKHAVEHLVYASSSSVYGANTKLPFSVHDNVDHPVSLYAATKKSNELMAHAYSHLYSLPTTGIRYFTVYGPWGRPDMSPWLFTSAMLEGRPIQVFNDGNMLRDFTYVDDAVAGTIGVLDRPPEASREFSSEHPDPASSYAPYKIYNIGNNQPVLLMTFISEIEKQTGGSSEKIMLPMQPGDVVATYADLESITRETGFLPSTPLEDGLTKWVDWYKQYGKRYEQN